jgi:ribokinase
MTSFLKTFINERVKNNNMFDVISFGSATMDIFIKVDADILAVKKKNKLKEYIGFPYGSKVLIKNIEHHSGGGGTNTAVSFAQSGLKTAFVGTIGIDHNGFKILNELKNNKIKFIGKTYGKSGYSVILESIKDRTILTYKGCNSETPLNDKQLKKLKAKWFYLTSMTDDAFDFSIKFAEHSSKINANLCFNPSSYLARKGLVYLKPILKNTFCLILNREEAQLLTKNKDIKQNLKLLLKKIKDKGIVIITDGANGAYAIYQNKHYRMLSINKKPRETTGAGDAFGSGFVIGLIKGKSIEDSLKTGLINATYVIQKLGAKEGFPGKELFNILEKTKINIIKHNLA